MASVILDIFSSNLIFSIIGSQIVFLLYNCRRIFFILSFSVGYILFFSLVRLRTFRLSAQVRAHFEHRCSCSRREDVTITDVIIKSQDSKRGTGDVNDDMLGSDGLGFLGILEKAVSWDLNLDGVSWFSELGEVRSVGVYEMRRGLLVSMEPKSPKGNLSFVHFGIPMHVNVLTHPYTCIMYISRILRLSYLPTPPHRQDLTQAQFLSGV